MVPRWLSSGADIFSTAPILLFMTGGCSKNSSDLCLGTMHFFATCTWPLVKLLPHSTKTGLFNRLDYMTCLTSLKHPQQCFLSRPPTNLPIKLLNSLSQHVSEHIKCLSKINSSTNKPLLAEPLKYAFILVSCLAQ